MEGPEFLSTHPITKDRISMAKRNRFKGIQDKELKELFESIWLNDDEKDPYDEVQKVFENFEDVFED